MRDPRRPSAAALLAVLVVLAGCASLGAPGDPRRTPYEAPPTATTESPTSASSTTAGFPSGVDEDGVNSPLFVLQSHIGILTLDSFRVVRERTVQTADGDRRSTRVDARVGEDRRRFHVEIATSRDGDPADGPVRVVHADVADGEQTAAVAVTVADDDGDGEVRSPVRLRPAVGDAVRPRAVLGESPNYRSRLFGVLSRMESASVERSGDGYRVTADSVASPGALTSGPETVSNASATVRVTDRGLVSEAVVAYTVTRDGRSRRVTERIAYSEVGSVTLPRPSWYDRLPGPETPTRTVGFGAGNVTAP